MCDYAAKTVAGKVAKVVKYCQLINNEPEEFRLYVVDSTLGALGIGQVQSRMPGEFDSNKRYAARPDTYRLMFGDLESSYLGTSHQPVPRNMLGVPDLDIMDNSLGVRRKMIWMTFEESTKELEILIGHLWLSLIHIRRCRRRG